MEKKEIVHYVDLMPGFIVIPGITAMRKITAVGLNWLLIDLSTSKVIGKVYYN